MKKNYWMLQGSIGLHISCKCDVWLGQHGRCLHSFNRIRGNWSCPRDTLFIKHQGDIVNTCEVDLIKKQKWNVFPESRTRKCHFSSVVPLNRNPICFQSRQRLWIISKHSLLNSSISFCLSSLSIQLQCMLLAVASLHLISIMIEIWSINAN